MVAELVGCMNEHRLKPRMLRSVVRDRLLDEKRPFPSPAELADVLLHVRDQGLLSERCSDTTDPKLVDAWRDAVDSWVQRIMLLASSKVPDKCWAGTCFLGLTCEECCSDRFQSSYSIWFQTLVENFQSPSCTHIVKVACCASLADLFKRLSCFPNLKKDGTLFSGKLILLVLQLLNEEAGETAWEVAVDLLCTLLSFFPSSIQRHYGNVEADLTSKIMEAKCNLNISKKLARGLALLSKVKGDEDSWCLIIQKILISINAFLTDAFQGLEEENKSFEVMKIILPSGKEPPLPLGGQTLLRDASESATKRIRELLVPRVNTLMDSLCIMLTNPHPLPVLIPVHSLLATVWRVLQVDGSFHGSLTTSMHQELLCAVLPALHLGSLDLLIAIIKSLRSQFLPHGVTVVRLLNDYFQRARLPSIRTKVYSIMQMLLISMGVGMTLYLSQGVINNASADLTDYIVHGSGSTHSNKQSSTLVSETAQQNHHRKRKRASAMPLEYPNGADISIKTSNKKPAYLSLMIAALKALEALLTVGGSLRSEQWRQDVDYLVITVATNASDTGWANEASVPADGSSSFADFQLATLELLLISLLSPTQGRPPYLSQGLDLFHRGRQETGTKLAAFCAKALLSLEVLIHPRALPLADPPPKNPSFDEGFYGKIGRTALNNGIKSNLAFSSGDLELLNEDEELSNSWFDKIDEQTFAGGRNPNEKRVETTNQSSKSIEDNTENPSATNAEASPVLVCENRVFQNVDVEMECLGPDENTIDREKIKEPGNEIISNNVSGKSGSPLGVSFSNHCNGAPNLASEDDPFKGASDLNEMKAAKLSYDSDLGSMDSLPDIVDADPDSDYSL